jgi:hypothetical protein
MGCLNSKSVDLHKNSASLSRNSGCENDNQGIDVLLLGAPQSGKSTIFRQMILLHGEGFSKNDFETSAKIIISNTVNSICSIVAFMSASDPDLSLVSTQIRKDIISVLEFKDECLSFDFLPDPYLWDSIERLWNNELVRQSFERFDYNDNYLLESADYFLDNISRLRDPFYSPNNDDILRFYVRTTGFKEFKFSLDQCYFNFNIIDCGSDHKRWVHLLKVFARETILVYCVSLSEYNLMSFRDIHKNRLHCSLNLFESVLDHSDHNAAIVLLLNKVDLFGGKLKKYPLSVCFPEYEGPDTLEDASQYIGSKFKAAAEAKSREIHVHYTCATDLNSGRAIWDDIALRSPRIMDQRSSNLTGCDQ